jgi:hypothetical protein
MGLEEKQRLKIYEFAMLNVCKRFVVVWESIKLGNQHGSASTVSMAT